MAELLIPDLEKQYGATKDTTDLYIGENKKGEDIIFYVGRAGSEEHEKASHASQQALERSRNKPKKRQRIMAELVARAILKGWKGLIDGDGVPIPCTLENKIAILTNKEYGKRIFVDVLEAANDINNFQDEDQDEEEEDDVQDGEGGDSAATPEEETEKNLENS